VKLYHRLLGQFDATAKVVRIKDRLDVAWRVARRQKASFSD
jgi:hypothetical protein